MTDSFLHLTTMVSGAIWLLVATVGAINGDGRKATAFGMLLAMEFMGLAYVFRWLL